MGSGFSQSFRKLTPYFPIFNDTAATQDSTVLYVDMASTSAAVGNVEASSSAVRRLRLTPENIRKLSGSIEDVKEFLSLAPSLLKRQRELEEQMANLQSLNQAATKDQITVNEGKAENISSSNRPSALEIKYQDFYDHQRVDAIVIIEKSRLSGKEENTELLQLKDSATAGFIFEEAYYAALESKKCFLEGMSSILAAAPKVGADIFQRKSSDPKGKLPIHASISNDAPALSQSVLNHLKVIMKETSDSCDVDALIQMTIHRLHAEREWFKQYDPTLLSKPEIVHYMTECCHYAWKLVCQTLPYVLGTDAYEKKSHKRFDPARHQVCRELKNQADLNSSPQLHLVIWPGLFVETPARVIRRTEVVLQRLG